MDAIWPGTIFCKAIEAFSKLNAPRQLKPTLLKLEIVQTPDVFRPDGITMLEDALDDVWRQSGRGLGSALRTFAIV